MNRSPSTEDMRRIACRFAELLDLLVRDGETERPAEVRDLLIDQLRDALDRRLSRWPSDDADFLGNTFLVEAVVHHTERTEISRLRHRDLGTLHAMKTIVRDRTNAATARALLLREARIGMTVSNGNLVVTQCAIRLSDGRPAIIMEWVGPSLAQRLAEGSVAATNVRAIAKSLLLGLGAIHDAGYVHGDISPANLLLDDDAQLKIADFGTMVPCTIRPNDLDIAKAGTPGFIAPEVSADATMQFSADLYAAGRVLKMLVEHCSSDDDAIEPLDFLAQRLSAPDPCQRPPSAVAALALIE